ncbi:hypothetical protein [Rhodomicrobium lacus]|uniref:hypothetical protein n=1 Tax=Rhodomicrobium lacus TaxID=2498452 RepID=UPI000F8F235A|nr:hypothetical protein [Rhodomicrobium lacus]
MTAYTPQKVTPAGVTATYNSASTTGDKVPASGNERDILHVKNGAASAVTLTIAAQTTNTYQEGVGTQPVPDLVITVPASGDKFVGPIPQAYVGVDGTYNLSWSSSASVTFAPLQLPPVSRSFL